MLSTASCKKKVESCKLGKSYISDGSSTPNPNIFSYYSDGRLQKIEYSNNTKDTLIYNADTLVVRTLDNTDSTTAVFTGVLNSAGNVTTGTKVYLDYSGNITSTESYLLEYNAEGNLTQKSVTDATGLTILSITYNGNNSATGTLFIAGVLDRKYTFYHSGVSNKTDIDDMNGVFTPYFGTPSANLLDSTFIITSTDTTKIQYSHTLDANEYVQKTIQTYLNHGADTKYLTYQYFDCNK